MSVVTAMEEAGPCRVKLTIEVPAPAVEAEIGRVVKDYRKHVQLPGFRRGKVPEKVVRRRFKGQIEREVVDRLLPRFWQQAQSEKSLDPLLPPQVEDLTIEEGQPMTVVASVETRPEIALGDIETFELPEDAIHPTESEIDEALLDLRRRFGRWETVERPVAQGDLVVGKAQPLDAEEGDDAEARPVHIEVGGQGVDEELSLALVGKEAGSSVEHVERHGEGEEAHEHRVSITLDEVKEQVLPELDEEFAKMIGDFDSVDKLREALAERLEHQKRDDLRQRRMQALLQQLRDRHPVALPEGVVQQESERLIREQAEMMARQGVDLEAAQIDWSQMLGQIRPVAERRVHERLVLDAIAKTKDLRLDEERFEHFLAAAAAEQKTSSLALRQRLDEDGRLEPLRGQLLREQTIMTLLGESEDGEPSEENVEIDDAEE